MSTALAPDEVQVLRFFETAPVEKAEAVFNIVAEKVRERTKRHPLCGQDGPGQASIPGKGHHLQRKAESGFAEPNLTGTPVE